MKRVLMGLTVKKCVQVVIVYFAEFEEVLRTLRAQFNLQINNDVPKGCLEQNRHSGDVVRDEQCGNDSTDLASYTFVIQQL